MRDVTSKGDGFAPPQGPMRQLADWIASGGQPTSEDMEIVPPAQRNRVRDAVKRIHALKADGANQDARTEARSVAAQVVRDAPEDWDYGQSKRADETDNMTPRELAARIRRQ